jgi:hypothetical protein
MKKAKRVYSHSSVPKRNKVLDVSMINSIIFWGALWGIAEATVGHLLHIVALPIGWLVWFPLAYGFMGQVYRQTGRPKAIFLTAVVAASIKLVDLLMPIRIDYVINPAVSIILEGLAVFTAVRISMVKRQQPSAGLGPIAVASVLWRALYFLYAHFLPPALFEISPVNGVLPLMRFLLFESTVNSFFIYGVFKLFRKRGSGVGDHCFQPQLALSLAMLGIACFIQWRI